MDFQKEVAGKTGDRNARQDGGVHAGMDEAAVAGEASVIVGLAEQRHPIGAEVVYSAVGIGEPAYPATQTVLQNGFRFDQLLTNLLGGNRSHIGMADGVRAD